MAVAESKLKLNGLQAYKSTGARTNWGGGKVTVSEAGDRTMTVVEAAVISDLLLRINHDLMVFESYESKLAHLNQCKINPPDYAKFIQTSIPREVTTKKARATKQLQSFNILNPSDVHSEWINEVTQRQLQGVEEEFTMERKAEIFMVTVNVVTKRINANKSK